MHTTVIRELNLDDIAPVAELYAKCQRVDHGAEYWTEDQLRRRLARPNRPRENCFVAEDGAGLVVGYGEVADFELPGQGFGECVVDPEHRGRGIGRALIRAGDSAFLRRKAELPSEASVYVWRRTPDTVLGASHAMEAEGYRLVRTGYTMRIDLDGSPVRSEPTELPARLRYRRVLRERDLPGIHAAIQEAFADQFGHAEDVPYETWQRTFSLPEYQDDDLWLIAVDGPDIAGVAIGGKAIGGFGREDWVDHLAVRPQWRGRGLGSTLLREMFRRFQAQGAPKVILGVDAENSSGALDLYRKVGMHVERVHLTYQKTLRGPEARVVR